MALERIIELDRIAKESVKKYARKRELYAQLANDLGKHFVGIAGPRGAGKTIILKQLALNLKNAFFISMENFDGDMFAVLKELKEKLKIETFLLDEVHGYKNFDKEIQSVYEFLEVKVFFTSSSAILMSKYRNDMSRRLLLKQLYPFSFREYIEFKENKKIDAIAFSDFINKELPSEILSFAPYFKDYLKGGLMPFALEEPAVLPLLENVLEVVIYKDIPKLNDNISMGELDIIKKLVKFAALSKVDGISYTSISKNLGVTKYKAEQYVKLLEQAFILQAVLPEGTNVLKEPKILLNLPYRLLYQNYDDCIGGLREDFFIESCKMLGKKASYLKSKSGEKTPDYILEDDDIIFEIGGKGKGRSQFKGIEAKRKIILTDSINNEKDKKPLLALGFAQVIGEMKIKHA